MISATDTLLPMFTCEMLRMGGGGGGGEGYIHKFSSGMDFKLILYCLETPKFIVTINWLLLSVLLSENPVDITKYFYCIETQKF